MLDLTAAESGIGRRVDHLRWRCRAHAVAQFILLDIVVFEIDPPAATHRVTHRAIGAERAAAGSTGQRQPRCGCDQAERQRAVQLAR